MPSSGTVLDRMHIGAGRPAAALHVLVDGRHHGLAQERPQRTAQLVGLGVDQRHGVAVVGSIGGVGVDHHVRVPGREEAVERLCRQAVALDEVAVQVEVAAIAAKAEGLGSDLVDPRAGVAVQAAVDVVDRNEQVDGGTQARQPLRLRAEIAHQCHAAVDAFGFARVDAVVVEEHAAPGGLDLYTVENTIGADHACMQRHAVVGHADLEELQHRREVGSQSLVPGDAFVPGRGLVLVAAFIWREVVGVLHGEPAVAAWRPGKQLSSSSRV
jgi:hypothetical protein